MGKSSQAKKSYLVEGLAMVIIAVVTLEVATLIQNHFARNAITAEAIRRAEDQLDANSQEINAILDQVETAVRNNTWSARKLLGSADSLWTVTRRMVENNDFIYGAAISLEWITDVIGKIDVYPTAVCMLISRTGKLMVCPDRELVMRRNTCSVSRECSKQPVPRPVPPRVYRLKRWQTPCMVSRPAAIPATI